jgi:hypothetical protein
MTLEQKNPTHKMLEQNPVQSTIEWDRRRVLRC